MAWDLAARASRSDLFPGPWAVALGIAELVRKGPLSRYVVASLFRVTWRFDLAVLAGGPLGWFRPGYWAFNPLLQVILPAALP